MAEHRCQIHPLPAISSPEDPRTLTTAQVDQWRHEGFCLVSGVFPATLIEQLRADVTGRFPAPSSEEANAIADFGSAEVFPSDLEAFNQVTLHPRLLTAVAQLLDTSIWELRLTQSDLWPKYGRTDRSAGELDNQDQRIHVDYPNHTLVHPPPWDRPEAVEAIVYLTDIDRCGAATAVVPRTGPDDPAYQWPIISTPGVGDLPYINDRTAAETYFAQQRPDDAAWRADLYRREHHTRFGVGDVLFYRHDTWHRGTPPLPGAIRLAHNITFRRAEAEWISTLHSGWAWQMYQPNLLMERLIANATVDQRTVLGFPSPDSPYWSPETVEAVEARYGPLGMDIDPYRTSQDAAP